MDHEELNDTYRCIQQATDPRLYHKRVKHIFTTSPNFTSKSYKRHAPVRKQACLLRCHVQNIVSASFSISVGILIILSTRKILRSYTSLLQCHYLIAKHTVNIITPNPIPQMI